MPGCITGFTKLQNSITKQGKYNLELSGLYLKLLGTSWTSHDKNPTKGSKHQRFQTRSWKGNFSIITDIILSFREAKIDWKN